MKLTENNYFSVEANKKYCSKSQFVALMKCEESALEEINGNYTKEWAKPTQTAFDVGSYVDCALTEPDKLPKFLEEHPNMIASTGKNKGNLKSEYLIANKMIERCKSSDFFMKTLSGSHQTIMTGEIEGVPFKIKMDAYKEGKWITDLKTCESIRKMYWDDVYRTKVPFIVHFGYDIQGAIYREIVRQNTGDTLPFFIAAVSKENVPDIEVIQISNEMLDDKLEEIKPYIQHVGLLKSGEIKPTKCCECDYCKAHKVLTRPILLEELWGLTEGDSEDEQI
jgi:hypothetical protein